MVALIKDPVSRKECGVLYLRKACGEAGQLNSMIVNSLWRTRKQGCESCRDSSALFIL